MSCSYVQKLLTSVSVCGRSWCERVNDGQHFDSLPDVRLLRGVHMRISFVFNTLLIRVSWRSVQGFNRCINTTNALQSYGHDNSVTVTQWPRWVQFRHRRGSLLLYSSCVSVFSIFIWFFYSLRIENVRSAIDPRCCCRWGQKRQKLVHKSH